MKRSSSTDDKKVIPLAELSSQENQKLTSFKQTTKPRKNTLMEAVVKDIWNRQ
jgi:hypothetical protein